MKKLFAMTILLALTVICFFTGCQNKSETNETKIVKTNISAEPDSLNPWKSAAADTEAIFFNVFEGLVSFNEKGEIKPALAKNWDISQDGLTYTFYLNENVLFHNGKKMTSADVFYTYSTLAGLNGEEPLTGKFKNIEKVEAVDDLTFKIILKSPSASFLGFNTVAVLPNDYKEQDSKPIGTGPFKFEQYIPSQKIVLVKNSEYYNEEKMPKIDKAEIMIMTDTGAVVSALKSGSLDIASVLPNDAKALEKSFDIYTSGQNMVDLFALNNSVKPLDNEIVRKAIDLAVDKNEIINGAFDGYATKIYSNFSPLMAEFYNENLTDTEEFNIEKAKELLKSQKLENGFDLTITVPGNYKQHIDTAQILVEQLKKININVKLDVVEWATWLEKVYTNADYQATVIGLSGKLDPNDILIRYTTDYKKNFIKFSNSEYDELIKNASTELEPAKRAEMYKDAQKILTTKNASIYICDPNLTIASKKNLKGYTFYPVNFIDFSKLYYEN